jgi:sugar O-acyltransferase (sialic acid O-acetyltransferase NeuD family)
MKPIGILGAGGHASETFCWARRAGYQVVHCYDSFKIEPGTLLIGGYQCAVSNKIKPDLEYIIGVGDPQTKLKILAAAGPVSLAEAIVDPSAILGEDIIIGRGSIIAPNSIITTDVVIGECATINSVVTIAHNSRIGDLFNAAPGVNISGNVTIGNRVTVGTNSAIREKIHVTDDVIIGMGAIVTKNLNTPGVYVGCPARKMKKEHGKI